MLIVGIWAFVGGCFAFGVVLFARPDIGAVTLALLFGLFSLVSGVTMVTRGVEIRRTGKSLHSVLPKAA